MVEEEAEQEISMKQAATACYLLHTDVLFGLLLLFAAGLDYCSTLKMAAMFPSKRRLTLIGLYGVISQKG
jgi:hypothetical protein